LSHPHRSAVRDLTDATKKDILALARESNVRFLRLQFTDILGVNKNVELPASQFEKALDGDIMFDGSSIEGFVRIEESDMLLSPDLSTFQLFRGVTPRIGSRGSSATSTRRMGSRSMAIRALRSSGRSRVLRR